MSIAVHCQHKIIDVRKSFITLKLTTVNIGELYEAAMSLPRKMVNDILLALPFIRALMGWIADNIFLSNCYLLL